MKGRNRDNAWYSILDSEWPAVKQAQEGWLDPSNFDAAGKQRRQVDELMAAARGESARGEESPLGVYGPRKSSKGHA